jgi:N-acetylneuraminic acid mutarotase
MACIATKISTALILGLGGLGLAGCRDVPDATEPVPGTSPAPDFLTAGGFWAKRASLPGARNAHAAAVVPNSSGQTILYVFGGYSGNGGIELKDVDAYNPATIAWTARADMPVRRRAPNVPAVLNGKVYVMGGVNSVGRATKTVLTYTPATNIWSRSSDSLPEPMAYGLSATISGKVYVLGGSRLYRYDPSLHIWKRLANTPHDHQRGGAGFINGRWYVAGGADLKYGQRWLDVYNPTTNTWTTKASMPTADVGAIGVVRGGKLYLMGQRTQVYDPVTNRWSTRATMPEPRTEAAGGTITRSGKSVILITGGYHERYAPRYSTARVDEYSE